MIPRGGSDSYPCEKCGRSFLKKNALHSHKRWCRQTGESEESTGGKTITENQQHTKETENIASKLPSTPTNDGGKTTDNINDIDTADNGKLFLVPVVSLPKV